MGPSRMVFQAWRSWSGLLPGCEARAVQGRREEGGEKGRDEGRDKGRSENRSQGDQRGGRSYQGRREGEEALVAIGPLFVCLLQPVWMRLLSIIFTSQPHSE